MRVISVRAAIAAAMLFFAVAGDAAWADDAAITATEARATLSDEAPGVTAPQTATIIGSGAFSPRLADEGAHYSLGGSNAQGTVAQDPAEGFVLDGLRVTPVNVASAATDGVRAGDDAVVFANTAPGADTAIRPDATGLETFTQVRDVDAPETYAWRVSLSAGQSLRRLPDGDVVLLGNSEPSESTPAPASSRTDGSGQSLTDPSAQLDETRKTLAADQAATDAKVEAFITAPSAVDANGAEVESWLSVSDDVVTLHVSHRAPGTAYPVEVDPKWWAGATVYSGYGPGYHVDAVKDLIHDLYYNDNVKFVVLVPQMFQGATQWANDGSAFYADQSLHTGDVRWIDGTTSCTPSTAASDYNQDVKDAIGYAKGLGMSVVVKPHVDLAYYSTPDGYIKPLGRSRTDIDANLDSDGWWNSYTCKIEKYAQVASSAGATDFIIGTELNLMSDMYPYDSQHWDSIISYIHTNYPSMKLGYAVNWDATLPSGVENLSQYFFNNQYLDYIGIDAYWSKGVQGSPYERDRNGDSETAIYSSWGTKTTDPGQEGSQACPPQTVTPQQLPRGRDPNAGYGSTPGNPGVVVQCLHNQYQKKIVFTELGYPEAGSNPDGIGFPNAKPGRGFDQAYAFWRDWVKASPFASGNNDRCNWFKGIWPWMFGAGTGTAADGYSITGDGAEGTMANNGAGPTGTCQP
jgi:hypothetical protein